MLSGAEVIHRDGSVVGKVGAFSAAVFCRMAEIPVYILADTGKISPFDPMDEHLTPFSREDLGIAPGDPVLQVTGCYFDRTPAEYIRAFVTEKGKVLPEDIALLAPAVHTSAWLSKRMKTQSVQ